MEWVYKLTTQHNPKRKAQRLILRLTQTRSRTCSAGAASKNGHFRTSCFFAVNADIGNLGLSVTESGFYNLKQGSAHASSFVEQPTGRQTPWRVLQLVKVSCHRSERRRRSLVSSLTYNKLKCSNRIFWGHLSFKESPTL